VSCYIRAYVIIFSPENSRDSNFQFTRCDLFNRIMLLLRIFRFLSFLFFLSCRSLNRYSQRILVGSSCTTTVSNSLLRVVLVCSVEQNRQAARRLMATMRYNLHQMHYYSPDVRYSQLSSSFGTSIVYR